MDLRTRARRLDRGWNAVIASPMTGSAALIGIQIYLWWHYVDLTLRRPSTSNVIQDSAIPLGIMAVIVWLTLRKKLDRTELVMIGIQIVNVISGLLCAFATDYWNYGTRANFHQQLDKVQALYYVVGTFTTAGTGNIVAFSDTAKRLQIAQQLVGFLLIAVGLAVVVSAVTSRATAD